MTKDERASRRGDMAHVQDIDAGCRGAGALAGSTLAAACVFATGSPPLEPSALEFTHGSIRRVYSPLVGR